MLTPWEKRDDVHFGPVWKVEILGRLADALAADATRRGVLPEAFLNGVILAGLIAFDFVEPSTVKDIMKDIDSSVN